MSEEELREQFLRERFLRQREGMTHQESISSRPIRPSSSLSDVWTGLKKGGQDLYTGVRQLIGDDKEKAQLFQNVKQERDAQEKAPAPLLEDFVRGATNVAPAVGAAFVPGGQSVLGGTLLGGVTSQMLPAASQKERNVNAALGFGIPLATTLGVRAFAPKVPIEPERLAAARAAKSEGLKLSGGQMTDDALVQRAEAHALWNPLAKWHARSVTRKQDDDFIKRYLTKVGVPEKEIPRNPSLNPETLTSVRNQISGRIEAGLDGAEKVDMTDPRLFESVLKAREISKRPEMKKEMIDETENVLNFIYGKQSVSKNDYQQEMRALEEAAGRLRDKGFGRESDALQGVRKTLEDLLPNTEAYRKAKGDYAKLITMEDALRRSSRMGEGVLDKHKLASTIEKNMPGGFLYGRSDLSDLARGGSIARQAGALPERTTGIPMPSDVLNAATYFRFNNPAAKAGFMNPEIRNLIEGTLRPIPGQGLLQSNSYQDLFKNVEE